MNRMPSCGLMPLLAAALVNVQARAGEEGMTPKLEFDEANSAVTITVPGIPGLRCDVWCYEDGLGKAASHRTENGKLVLVHRNPKVPGVTVTTTFAPSPGGVDQVVTVEGESPEAVRKIAFVNPCVQFGHSATFGKNRRKNPGYVDDFVARCFVFLEGGMTLLGETGRLPGSLPANDRNAPRVNCEKPWIQEYVPAWEKHHWKDQKGIRGYSTDRPVLPIIGTVSHDGKYLAAVAWPETHRLGQVWMYCIHPRPCILTAHRTGEKRIISRGKLYFMPNDGKALIEAFEKDFPSWKELANRPTKWG